MSIEPSLPLDAFLAGDYRAATAHLDALLTGLRHDGAMPIAPSRIAQIKELLHDILQSAEQVHVRQLARTANGKAVIHTNTAVLEKIEEIVRALDDGANEETTGELAWMSAHIRYLWRDLDAAIAILKAQENRLASDFLAMQLLATCHMLNDQPDEARHYIDIALRLAPDDIENQRLDAKIADFRKKAGALRLVSGRWPTTLIAPQELDKFVRSAVLADSPFDRPLMTQSSRIVAIGSCFATNLTAYLKQFGMDTFSFPFGEEINNSYTNLLVIRALDEGASAHDIEALEPLGVSNEELDKLRDYIRTSDVLIYTLGVSLGFFDSDNRPALVAGFGGINRTMLNSAHFRYITAEENLSNVREIVACIRRLNPDISIVFTVSPVPLARTFNSHTAVIDDCLSKSTLRLTAHGLTHNQEAQRLYYWPSFEIAKWTAPHIDFDTRSDLHFGADDGFSRHVSDRTVEIIVRLFIEFASADTGDVSAAR